MLKSIFLVAVVLAGRVAAAEGITEQDQIYVVSGVLGGVCLLLTIAAIVNAVNVIKLQTKVAVLQATANASAKTVLEAPRKQQPVNPVSRGEELNRYSQQEDPYRGAPARENHRMERPVPPPRPQRIGPSARDNYY